ncbi:hypothetical protein GL50803_007577 [Giardia duodenalis]|uniref:Uncharacterized protein n=1 Tax=Giardia intestinalis (strain ATCC 50803 / WB clone C6) TaxID=184922 RepID=D3KHX9_GIAIC|nr:hypothetical protein GL50803_007577 [Giardia intestinalis]KAE8304719.1 hypothetical protein GL50803_007577 [Giardia intestinalis]
MQASAAVLFTRDGYILQVAVSPQLEPTLPADEFISIARFASFLLISGESRVTNARIRKYYAIVSSIGHVGCVLLYISPLATDAVQYALVQSVFLLSMVHHYSGPTIISISEYIEYFNSQYEQKMTASQPSEALGSESVLSLSTASTIQPLSSPVRRFYTCQPIYPKIRKHFRHETLDYFTRLAFLTCLTPPRSARNLLCQRNVHDKELFILNLSSCLGLVYVVLPYSASRSGCILRLVGERLKWTLQQNPGLSAEIGYLCCLSSQVSWCYQDNPTDEAGLVPSTAYLCNSYQLVTQPCRFVGPSLLDNDESTDNQPPCSFYLCLAALLTRESLKDVEILEYVTATSARLQLTPFETHKQLFQLAIMLCHPFHDEARAIKERPERVPTASAVTVIPTQPPLFAKKAVSGTIALGSTIPHGANKKSSSELTVNSKGSRVSIVGISDSSNSTGSNIRFTTDDEKVTAAKPLKVPRHR